MNGYIQGSRSQGIAFASALPTVLRAIFVKNWDVTSDPLPFPDRQSLIIEVKAVRPNHNLTPDNAIEAVAQALRGYVDPLEFERVLETLPADAKDYWAITPPEEQAQRPSVSLA